MTDAPPPPPPAWEIVNATTGAVITQPIGAFVRHDVRLKPAGSPFHVGVFDSYLIVSNEVGVQAGVTTNPAFLGLTLEAAVEPGFYVKAPRPGEPPADPDLEEARSFGVRRSVRAQANTNLRSGPYWLYGRTTGSARFRDFVEDDPFREILIEDEWGFEQATAFLYNVGSEAPAFWVYGEYTVGAIDRVGTTPNRVSCGVISEKWLLDGLSMDLDFFYALDEHPRRGPGVIFAWWYLW